jgi:formylglycine-generating enzyme required for sulfatase activity
MCRFGWVVLVLSVASPLSAADRPAGPLTTAEERALKPSDSFKECDACPEMVVVPAGRFEMGSPSDEPERTGGETQVSVSIGQPFAIGKFAITFDEWDACFADSGCNAHRPHDLGWGRDRRPVVNVSWDDAKAYAAWLSAKTGKTYRLPTETEREYVTRAGTNAPFWWGSSVSTSQANYNGNYAYLGGGSKGEYRYRTMPVSNFEANPWGLSQVHGNVWEWTEDCWNDSNIGNPRDGSARKEGDCSRHVVRGGSFYNIPSWLRAARRHWFSTVIRNPVVGFRVARGLDP